MNKNKFPEVSGVIYAKPVKKNVEIKKGPNKGQFVDIPSLVLDFSYNGSDKSQLLSFNIARNIPIDEFEVQDRVVVTYATESIPWKDDYITKARAIYIKHADVDYNDTKDLRPQRPTTKKDDVFVPPSPNEKEEDDQSDLPF